MSSSMRNNNIDIFRLISDLSAYLYLLIFLIGNILLGVKNFLENSYVIYTSLALVLIAVFFGLINKPAKQLPSATLARSVGGLIAISLLSVEYFFVFQKLKTSVLITSVIILTSFLVSLLMVSSRKVGNPIKYLLFLAGVLLTVSGGLAQVFIEKLNIQTTELGYYGLFITLVGLIFLALLIFNEER
ncbi:MAG: hypothetical protein QXS21_02670 [Thermoproteota archaeon]|nr:hypothetical protein [Candidatus Brockarchaeota archaeon]